MTILPAGAADRADIEHLLDDAFGYDRLSRTAYRLRAGMAPLPGLSFVIRDRDGRMTGSLQCWPIRLTASGGSHDLILLGPVAVSPDLQGTGLGKELMDHAIAAAMALDNPPMLLIGDPEYYGRWGFTDDATGHWQVPGPVERRRLLARIAPGQSLPDRGTIGPRTGAASRAA